MALLPYLSRMVSMAFSSFSSLVAAGYGVGGKQVHLLPRFPLLHQILCRDGEGPDGLPLVPAAMQQLHAALDQIPGDIGGRTESLLGGRCP